MDYVEEIFAYYRDGFCWWCIWWLMEMEVILILGSLRFRDLDLKMTDVQTFKIMDIIKKVHIFSVYTLVTIEKRQRWRTMACSVVPVLENKKGVNVEKNSKTVIVWKLIFGIVPENHAVIMHIINE